MIDRSTSIRGALRQRQRGFIINPFVLATGGGGGGTAWDDEVDALNPVMWLPLSEPSGTLADLSGGGHDAVENGTGITRAQAPIFTNMGDSIEFAGSGNHYLSVADAAALDRTGDLTFIVAMKRAGAQTGAFPKIAWKPTEYANGRCNYGFIYIASTNKVIFRVNASSTYYDAQSTTALADATSYLLVGRRSGTEVSIWVNNSKEATAALPSSGTNLDTGTDSLYAGGGTGEVNDRYDGTLGQMILFNYALSDTQIGDLWAARA